MQSAQAVGVEGVIAIGTHLEDWAVYRDLAKEHRHFFRHTIGLHPGYVDEQWEDAVMALSPFFADITAPVALGEIGLDYFRLPSDAQEAEQLKVWQREAFQRQLALAYQFDVPVVVHSRHAFSDCVAMIDASGVDWKKVVFHCFVEGPDEMKVISERGGRGSFTGIITYPKSESVRLALQSQGHDRLMLETDSPYLSPQSVRSQENSPSNLPEIAQKAASLLNVSAEKLCEITTANTREFFQW
jgi:TatD DNase family protein